MEILRKRSRLKVVREDGTEDEWVLYSRGGMTRGMDLAVTDRWVNGRDKPVIIKYHKYVGVAKEVLTIEYCPDHMHAGLSYLDGLQERLTKINDENVIRRSLHDSRGHAIPKG